MDEFLGREAVFESNGCEIRRDFDLGELANALIAY